MITGKLKVYLHTVRYLKLRQLFFLVLRRALPLKNKITFHGNIRINETVRMVKGADRDFVSAGKMQFRFLNISRCFEPDAVDWTSREMDKLWRYNLHYFDYLNDENRPFEDKAFLVNDWIAKNPHGMPDAWEPFPVSLRIVNWIKFFLTPEATGKVKDLWLRSLYEQVLWLEKNIEYHLMANHYFKNGKALFFVGVYFAGPDAERWLKKGIRILDSEIDEQILPDGGHFERSPMYHSMILEDCLDILNIGQAGEMAGWGRLSDRLREKCRLMTRFLLGMTHPDGDIALFNDAAVGIETRPGALVAYYERLKCGDAPVPAGDCWSFPETGYYVMAPGPGDRLIIDCGPVGPDYQPGHSHCDSLSFELSLRGRRIIVDSGCSQYRDGDIRRYNRGNAGHNTLTVDGENQSAVWGAHRCARRARPLQASLVRRQDGSLHFSGAHDGYRHLAGAPIHKRTFTWSGGSIAINDTVSGGGIHDIEQRLHVNPSLAVKIADGKAIVSDGAEVVAVITVAGSARVELTEGFYCPEFGLKIPCAVLSASFCNFPLPFRGGWTIALQ